MRALGGRFWLPACVALLVTLVLAPAAAAQQFTWLAPITLENSGGTQGARGRRLPERHAVHRRWTPTASR